jgi:uncharacterized MAPEG superfamily protein
MSVELTLLLWSLVIYGLYLGAQSSLYRLRHGVLFAATARDEEAPPDVRLGRAERALKNFLETWPALIILVLVVELARRSDALTLWGAHLWFWSRLAYLPLYLFGVVYVRSLVWCVSATGLFLMFIGVLF